MTTSPFPLPCASCSQPILRERDAMLEWGTVAGRPSSPRIVHHIAASPRGPAFRIEGGRVHGGCYSPQRGSTEHASTLRRYADHQLHLRGLRNRAQDEHRAAFDQILRALDIPISGPLKTQRTSGWGL